MVNGQNWGSNFLLKKHKHPDDFLLISPTKSHTLFISRSLNSSDRSRKGLRFGTSKRFDKCSSERRTHEAVGDGIAATAGLS